MVTLVVTVRDLPLSLVSFSLMVYEPALVYACAALKPVRVLYFEVDPPPVLLDVSTFPSISASAFSSSTALKVTVLPVPATPLESFWLYGVALRVWLPTRGLQPLNTPLSSEASANGATFSMR